MVNVNGEIPLQGERVYERARAMGAGGYAEGGAKQKQKKRGTNTTIERNEKDTILTHIGRGWYGPGIIYPPWVWGESRRLIQKRSQQKFRSGAVVKISSRGKITYAKKVT